MALVNGPAGDQPPLIRMNEPVDYYKKYGPPHRPVVDPVANAAAALRLHKCSAPWQPGQKKRSVPARMASVTLEHHNLLLFLLNRISEDNMKQMLREAVSLLMPCSELALATMETVLLEHSDKLKLREIHRIPRRGAAPATPKKKVERTPTDMKQIRKDMISMMFQKTPDEEVFTKDYAKFLYSLCYLVDNYKLTLHRMIDEGGPTERITEQLTPAEDGTPELLVEEMRQLLLLEDDQPCLQELINTEAIQSFQSLYRSLTGLVSSTSHCDEFEESTGRRHLRVQMRLITHLHLLDVLPVTSLHLVRDTLADPLKRAEELEKAKEQQQDEDLLADYVVLDSVAQLSISDGADGAATQAPPSANDAQTIRQLSSEMLAVYLCIADELNIIHAVRSDELLDLLERQLPHLCKRQVYLVQSALHPHPRN